MKSKSCDYGAPMHTSRRNDDKCSVECHFPNAINFNLSLLAGDIDDCIITPIQQTQFTPLTEAICDVIMDLTSHGQSATLETIKKFLSLRFAHMQQPSNDIIYDTLSQLQQERKIYQTSKGYFIVTPE